MVTSFAIFWEFFPVGPRELGRHPARTKRSSGKGSRDAQHCRARRMVGGDGPRATSGRCLGMVSRKPGEAFEAH